MRCQIKLTIASVCFFILLLNGNLLQAEQHFHNYLSDSVKTEKSGETDSAKTTEAMKAEATLIGRWENPYFVAESGSNNRGATARSLKYHFRPDGTYTKSLGGAETQVEETGTWKVSATGNQVTMYSRSSCGGQMVTSTARIMHLSNDELVLEQTMCVAGVMVAAAPQEFYFNKF